MVAILFAAFSMATTVVYVFKHKADLERPISLVGVQDMIVITVRVMCFLITSLQKDSQFSLFNRDELLFFHWSLWFILS